MTCLCGALQVGGLLALTALQELSLVSGMVFLGGKPWQMPGRPWEESEEEERDGEKEEGPGQPLPLDGLPPSLTRLALDGYASRDSEVLLPPQVRRTARVRGVRGWVIWQVPPAGGGGLVAEAAFQRCPPLGPRMAS